MPLELEREIEGARALCARPGGRRHARLAAHRLEAVDDHHGAVLVLAWGACAGGDSKGELEGEIEKMKAELARKEAEIAELAEEKEDAEKEAETFRDEAGLIGQRELEKCDNELRRARMIRDALLIGKVSEYIISAELGGFVTIEIVMPDHVQAGSILAIRRNTGILGRVTVTEVTAQGAIASPMPGFGPVEPQAGDELIIPPQF